MDVHGDELFRYEGGGYHSFLKVYLLKVFEYFNKILMIITRLR